MWLSFFISWWIGSGGDKQGERERETGERRETETDRRALDKTQPQGHAPPPPPPVTYFLQRRSYLLIPSWGQSIWGHFLLYGNVILS